MAELWVLVPAAQQGPEGEDEDTGPHDCSRHESQGNHASEKPARMQQQQGGEGSRGAEKYGKQAIEWQRAEKLRLGGEVSQDLLPDRLGKERRGAIKRSRLQGSKARVQVRTVPRTRRARLDMGRQRRSRRVPELVHHLPLRFFARHG